MLSPEVVAETIHAPRARIFACSGSAAEGSEEGSRLSLPTGSVIRLASPVSIAREIRGLLSPNDLAVLFPGPREVAVVKDEGLFGGYRLGWIFRKPIAGSFDQLCIFRILRDIGSFAGV